ncbi:MAG: ADP compounds hydrolase NudE [Arenicellales bacterium]
MPEKPKILGLKTVAQTKIFRIEAVDLEFSNGARCEFERINSGNLGAVMVLAILDDTLVMVREYAVGSEQYELGLVKGLIDEGESPEVAANRECMEEIGFGVEAIQMVRKTNLIPHYNCAVSYLMLAEGLYPKTAKGDEPEALEKVLWPLARLDELLTHPEITDVRTLYAIYWLKEHLKEISA